MIRNREKDFLTSAISMTVTGMYAVWVKTTSLLKEKNLMIIHPIAPIYNAYSKVLILGSFPSVKSREAGFFYGHPQNRFWKVLAKVFGEKTPETIEEKKAFLLRNHVAVWDVIHSCDIEGSSDSSIRNVVANDLNEILKLTDIREIYVNGKTALKYYKKYTEPKLGRDAKCLPSTSPANAQWNIERLVEEWKCIRTEGN
jgi:hypoxanthine-DNA glycosylase